METETPFRISSIAINLLMSRFPNKWIGKMQCLVFIGDLIILFRIDLLFKGLVNEYPLIMITSFAVFSMLSNSAVISVVFKPVFLKLPSIIMYIVGQF